jgi:hypothetical protein
MRTSVPRAMAIVVLCAAFVGSTATVATAKGPGGGGGKPHGFSQGEKSGWKGGKVPPGWKKGKKTGWGNHHRSPPGWR